jgi:hypothetical protein
MNRPNTHTNSAAANKCSRLRSRCIAAIVLMGACLAVVPAGALAAKPSNTVKPINKEYKVTVKPMALAKGNTVQVKATITAPEAKVQSWWSQKSVAAVVRKGVNGGYQSPYTSEGYRCTPVIRGEKTTFNCKLMGADVPTTIHLSFTVVYRGDTASG